MVGLRYWYQFNPERLRIDQEIWLSLPFFRFEERGIDPARHLTVLGLLEFRRPRSGRIEQFRIRLEYPSDFPWRVQEVFDHDHRFELHPDGHLVGNHRLCLTFSPRKEFTLGSRALTEEILGASLVWFDKRLIYERTGKWPGKAEPHGRAALIEFTLEQAGLLNCPPAIGWAEQLFGRWITNGRPIEVDIYEPCPCGSGAKLKFCHRDAFRDFLKTIAKAVSVDSYSRKAS